MAIRLSSERAGSDRVMAGLGAPKTQIPAEVATPVRPLLLDLFCGAGGAAMGYHRAGFEVVGIDHNPQPHYPFEFILQDALEVLRWPNWVQDMGFSAVHASPPCQDNSTTRVLHKGRREVGDFITPTRPLLEATGLPWVIENVPPHSPMRPDFILCGTMFGLHVIRHRWFEANWPAAALLPPCAHMHRAAYGRTPRNGEYYTISGHFGDMAGGSKAMGIDWMTRDELAQAIPPAYTEWIGRQLMEALRKLKALPQASGVILSGYSNDGTGSIILTNPEEAEASA